MSPELTVASSISSVTPPSGEAWVIDRRGRAMEPEFVIGEFVLAWSAVEREVFRFSHRGIAPPVRGMRPHKLVDPAEEFRERLRQWRARFEEYLAGSPLLDDVRQIHKIVRGHYDLRNDVVHNVANVGRAPDGFFLVFHREMTVGEEEKERVRLRERDIRRIEAAGSARDLAKRAKAVSQELEKQRAYPPPGQSVKEAALRMAIDELKQARLAMAKLYWDAKDHLGEDAYSQMMRTGE